MDEIWIYVIEAVIVAAISVAITIISKNGFESKILGLWEKMKVTYETWKPIVALKDEELAEQISTVMKNLETAFADGGLTLAEFNSLRKDMMPIWNKFVAFIEALKNGESITDILSLGEETEDEPVKPAN